MADTQQTDKRGGMAYRVIVVALCAGIMIALAQLGFRASAYIRESAAYASARPAMQLTATALAPDTVAPKLIVQRAQVFPTNTPSAPDALQATATPEPVVPDATPRPLPTLFIYSGPDQASNAPLPIPTAVPQLDRQGNDLMNIVLLGNDNEITGESVARTDTIMILSINRTANSVSLLSLPRDLYVFIPSWTMQRINAAYPYGESVGWTDGGFGLLRQTLFYNFGINVHYYAMVDLTGFKALVDAVGGVELSVDCAIQDLRLVGAEVPAGAYRYDADGYYVLPVGHYEMSGEEALWYARSRYNSTDFDRGRRQQQVVRAVWRAAREQGLFTQLPNLWTQFSPYLQTNLAFEDILGLAPLAAGLDPGRIETFTMVRTYHTTPWQTPDGDYVQLPVYETLRPMLEDFYTPPTDNRIASEAATIAVYNGTDNPGWDLVAAERLQWEGFNAVAMGSAPETGAAATSLVDYTGATKGSSLEAIADVLNLTPDNVSIVPSAEREYDFTVTIGESYNSCTTSGVIAVPEGTATPSTSGG
jgi:polyisoprenyl-teichoic acid--peptidoglycan teichoic acid transferase